MEIFNQKFNQTTNKTHFFLQNSFFALFMNKTKELDLPMLNSKSLGDYQTEQTVRLARQGTTKRDKERCLVFLLPLANYFLRYLHMNIQKHVEGY